MITATVQIVLNLVHLGYIKISDFNLLIFDECHNAQKEHPMASLMAKFNEYPANEHPRVIGLTGMLTAPSIKPINVLSDLDNLEARFRATITTAHGDSYRDVLQHSTCPNEQEIQYETNPPMECQDSLFYILKNMTETINEWPMSDREKQLKIKKNFEPICEQFKRQLKNLGKYIEIKFGPIFTMNVYQFWSSGLYGSVLANLAAIIDLEMKKREACTTTTKWIARALITSELMS